MAASDHEAAYKHQPDFPPHSGLAAIALRSPGDKQLYGFTPRTHLFGSIATVLHNDVFSRLLVTLICNILGIPTVGYFSDFAPLVPSAVSSEGQVDCGHAMLVILKNIKATIGPPQHIPGNPGRYSRAQERHASIPPLRHDQSGQMAPPSAPPSVSGRNISRRSRQTDRSPLIFPIRNFWTIRTRADGPAVPEAIHLPVPGCPRRRRGSDPQIAALIPWEFRNAPRSL